MRHRTSRAARLAAAPLLAAWLAACGGGDPDAAGTDATPSATDVRSERSLAAPAPTRWSDPATWGGTLPTAGASVVVPAGKTVVLDTATPPLRQLTIEGTLQASPAHDVAITADAVMVRGGRLEIGTPSAPYTRRATITLTGATTADIAMAGFGAKVLGVTGGTLSLHGQPVARSWTKLAADVQPGATRLVLAEAPGWRVGDQIVIATSSPRQGEHDVATIAAISGATVTLAQPLRWGHRGALRNVAGVSVDLRTEVGLLSRNIVVQGDAASESLKIGGHAMFMAGTGGTTVQIARTEFRRMGQLNQLGRYPLHFHIMRDGCVSCYVQDSTVRDTVQRGIVLHETNGVRVASNVVYNTVGHNIMVETTDTVRNVIDGNLALVNRQPNPLHTQRDLKIANDRLPANYWFKDPRNVVTNNHAAGAFSSGFIYDGIGNQPVDFRRNVVHAAMSSEGAGEGDFDLTGGVVLATSDARRPDADRIEDTLSYHNASGFWPEEGGTFVITRLTAVDNIVNTLNRGVGNRVVYRQPVFIDAGTLGRPTGSAVHYQYGSDVTLESPTFVQMGRSMVATGTDIGLPTQANLWVRDARFIGSRPVAPDVQTLMVTLLDDSLLPAGTYATDAPYATAACTSVWVPTAEVSEPLASRRCATRHTYAELDVRDGAAPSRRMHMRTPIARSDGLRFARHGMFGYSAILDGNLGYAVETASRAGHMLRVSTAASSMWMVDPRTVRLPVSVPLAAPPSGVFRTGNQHDRPSPANEAARLRPAATLADYQANPLTTWWWDPAARRVHAHATDRWLIVRP